MSPRARLVRTPSLLRSAFVVGVLGLSILAASAPAPAHAQAADNGQVKRFRLADSYMRAGQYDRAITLLEDLYGEAPQNHAFYSKLKEAYESVKRYDDAIALIDEYIERQPSPMLMSEKAQVLYLKGDEEAAFDAWDQAIAMAPDRSSTYRVVYQALVDARRFERAVEVMKQGREALNAPDQFRVEMAYLYSLTGEHREAMKEYVALLQENDQRLNFVRGRLDPFVEQDSAMVAGVDVLNQAVRTYPMNLAYRELLGWLYMEANQYDEAFDVYRALDRLQRQNGGTLYVFARRASDAGAYQVASKAYDEIVQRYPNSPVGAEVQRGLGDMHRRWAERSGERAVNAQGERIDAPHYEAALNAYRTFLHEYPTHPEAPQVLLDMGRLQRSVFLKLDAAESTLKDATNRFPETPAADEAQFDLGRLELMRGHLDDARLIFSRLVERLRTGDLADQARYELALLHFYDGEFDAALTRAKATNENTTADVANDAIELKVLIMENRGPDSLNVPLSIFAQARLKERQRQYPAAETLLDSLLRAHGQHPLSDDARFMRAGLLNAQGRPDEAVQAYTEIPLIHPNSAFVDQSLYQAALIRETQDELEQALELYNRLLEEHPNSLLAAEVRSRIRSLWERNS